eukprot:TRINITY_DN24094_c0_g1_i1.p1 TRINITY_DN24094_c0_g1~~TRINITY_DN24094_c0_g1_i1.p1  ORF type:complete len:114 (+),score=7.75 TRINITY_DN24094_c0_g1_i1:235-576(+)
MLQNCLNVLLFSSNYAFCSIFFGVFILALLAFKLKIYFYSHNYEGKYNYSGVGFNPLQLKNLFNFENNQFFQIYSESLTKQIYYELGVRSQELHLSLLNPLQDDFLELDQLDA